MAFHLAAFWENIDHAGVRAPIAAALGEQVLFIAGDDIRIPDDTNQMVAAAANVALLTTDCRLVSPSLRRFVNPQLAPVNSLTDGNVEPQSPAVMHDWRRNPIPLDPGESLNAEADSNPAAAADQSVLVWLADGPLVPIEGAAIHPVLCTATITAVAGAWTNGQLTFSQDLPTGRYAVCGMRIQGATCIAGRLVFRGGSSRPGVIGTDAITDDSRHWFRYGLSGIFGEFDSNTPPTLDVLANDADTAQTVILDLAKLS